MAIPPDQLMTSHDVARLLQVDPSSVVKWARDGLLTAFLTPGGHRRFKASDVVVFLRTHKMFVPPELTGAVRRVLLVDDDPLVAKALERGLKRSPELQVSTRSSGVAALVEIGASRPDVLVLDLHLPDLDGLQILERLKANPATASIVVVLVSGKLTAELGKRAMSLGAKAVLAKPVTAATLKQAIEI